MLLIENGKWHLLISYANILDNKKNRAKIDKNVQTHNNTLLILTWFTTEFLIR